jgi:polysaccharide biosynthesis protein PelF
LKICLILEGSYPYVRGGVSTWVHGVIQAMPEHEFVLWTIADTEDIRGQFKYEIPDSVIDIHENALSSSLNLRIQNNPNLRLSKKEKKAVSKLLKRGNPEWRTLLESFHGQENKSVEFFISEEFLSILKDFSKDEFPYAGFKDLFWTIRSMYLPLLYLIGQPMPEADLYHSASTGYAGVLGALASMKYNKPYVLTEHGIYTREREEEILRSDWVVSYFKDLWISMFYMFARLAYQHAHSVTSLYQRASLTQQDLGCPPSKCEVVANGLRVERFANIPPKEENGWVDIAAIVRFAHIKDIKTMIYTFSRLKQEFKNARLHLLGGVDDA